MPSIKFYIKNKNSVSHLGTVTLDNDKINIESDNSILKNFIHDLDNNKMLYVLDSDNSLKYVTEKDGELYLKSLQNVVNGTGIITTVVEE